MTESTLETFIIDKDVIKPSFPVPGPPTGFDLHHEGAVFNAAPEFVAFHNNTRTMLHTSNAVGLLSLKKSSGSAFFVSPTIICTAAHNLYVDGVLTLRNDARTFSTEYNGHPTTHVYDLEGAKEEAASWVCVSIDERDPVTTSMLHRANDFYFLRLDPHAPPSQHFLLPSANGVENVVAFGYPGFTSQIIAQLVDLPVSLEGVMSAFSNVFLHKHAAPGRVLAINDMVLAHSASTLKGCSGGPIVDSVSGHFVAIQTEGPADFKHNLGISVKHPIFKQAYKTYVLPTLPAEALSIAKEYLGL